MLLCCKYKFEQEIVARVEDEKIIFDAARDELIAANSVKGSIDCS